VVRLVAALWAVATGVGGSSAADEVDPDLYVRGGEVFQANCAACHGTQGEGGPGPGVLDGPPIVGLDLSYVDMTVRTGRMPIPEPAVGVRTDRLGEDDREALAVYVAERFDLPGEIPTVGPGDASRGQELFVRNCAACHGAAGDGGVSGGATRVPRVVGLDPIAIAQATRVGPFEMPAFEPAVLDDGDIDDLVSYVELVGETPRTAAGVREVDQISAALFAVGLSLGAAVVMLIVARARRWYLREPEGIHAAPPFEPRS
jgi:ubiquinol-cytochrome c reductase cytochrome c subunit